MIDFLIRIFILPFLPSHFEKHNVCYVRVKYLFGKTYIIDLESNMNPKQKEEAERNESVY